MSDPFIPLSEPCMGGNASAYVQECIATNWVSSVGAFVDRFERMTADYVGLPHAVAAVNGTAALHIALLVAGVEPGDAVIVPALTFVAPVNAVRYAGALPVFMDAEPEHFQMDVAKLARFLQEECDRSNGTTVHRATGRPLRAVIPVHVIGHPVDMDPLMGLAREHGLVVIEDATESLGSTYKGRMTGSIGDLGCFSYNGNKIITTGGGGMLVTAQKEWAGRAKYLTTQAKDDPLEYIHNSIGYNYRLTNLLAALGCAQMEQLESFLDKKRAIARRYDEAFRNIPGLRTPRTAEWAAPNAWLYTVLVDETAAPLDSRELMRRLQAQGIQSRPLWHPIYTLPPYADCPAYRVETADILYRRALSIPCSVGLTEADQDRVSGAVAEGLQKGT
ncbi:MAG TPA: aminotransferase DegT [Syntrophus sp. (in: bacteria)]|jgi:perosamine synthetase|nr:aminotransferase DegT [Syntrophus sp. (in: bacteria)]